MATEQVILLADSDVLIDYAKTDLSILGLVSRHIGKLNVLDEVLDTVDGLTKASCKRHGIKVIEADIELLLRAGQRSGALSFKDWLCYLICEREDWICTTNDRGLIRTCCLNEVQSRRGLRLMIDLAKDGHLAKSRALRVARAIQKTNPYHIDNEILSRFIEALEIL